MQAMETAVRDAVARGYNAAIESGGDNEDAVVDGISKEVMAAVGQFDMQGGAYPPGYTPGPPNNPSNHPLTAMNPLAPTLPNYSGPVPTPNAAPGADFLRHPETGHLIGIEQAPPAATTQSTDPAQYPKWVTPHVSWVQRDASGRPMAPMFAHQHVDRTNPENFQVMVNSPEEEERALAEQREAENTAAERQAPNAGVGGADATGAKTMYPAGNEDAEKADNTGETAASAGLNEELKDKQENPASDEPKLGRKVDEDKQNRRTE